MSAYDVVINALHASGSRQTGRDWTCPHHKNGTETSPSLSVTEGAKGVIMNCHAGCTTEEVVGALHLKMSDLFDEKLTKEKTHVTDTYSYTDAGGNEIFQVLRKVGSESGKKTFSQRRKENGQWVYNLRGVERGLYRLPEVRLLAGSSIPLYICEGEKDVEAVRSKGQTATCNPGGAGKWRDVYGDALTGIQRVIIVADKDDVGKSHAKEVAASLKQRSIAFEIVEAKEGKDAFDHFAHGYNIDEFLPVNWDDVADVSTETTSDDTETNEVVNPMFAKLLEANDIDNIPPPQYLIQDFLVAGSMCALWGLPGAGKSFVAIDWALSIANNLPWLGHPVQGGEVLYFVAEGLSGIGPRKRSWQAERGVDVPSGIRWYPEAVNLLDPQQVDQMVELVDTLQPLLIVVDTLGRSMPGGDENAPGPMSQAIEALDRLRKVAGACVLIVHHTPKDGSGPRGHSSLAGAVQTSIKCVNTDGEIWLTVEKQKDDEAAEINLRLRKVGDSCVLSSGFLNNIGLSSMAELEMEDALRTFCGPEGMAANLFLEVSGLSKATFYRLKEPMRARGLLVNVGTEKQPRWTHRDLISN